MAHSLKSVRHLLQDKPTLHHLEHETNAQRALLAEIRRLLPGELAAHCVSARLHGERLVLHADSPVWASRLRFMSAELLSLLENGDRSLREIKIRLLPTRGQGTKRTHPARRSQTAGDIVAESAQHVESAPLRRALQRLSRTLKRPD